MSDAKPQKSFFTVDGWKRLVSEAERDARCSPWFVSILHDLETLAPALKPSGETKPDSRFDMIYPH